MNVEAGTECREESRVLINGIAALYVICGLSFLACAVMLIVGWLLLRAGRRRTARMAELGNGGTVR